MPGAFEVPCVFKKDIPVVIGAYQGFYKQSPFGIDSFLKGLSFFKAFLGNPMLF